jgi:CubicO group peptidase (beta-lactamase class C family)
MKKSSLILFALIVSLQVCAKSNTKKIDSLLNELFEKNGPGGVALVVKDGKTVYRKAFGMANLELGVKMTPKNIFRVGSVTKQFTAAAIIQLAEQGKIDLRADITQYLKGYPTQDQKITVENLLTHTSGVKSFTSTKDWTTHKKMQDLSSTELINFFKDQEMTMIPGEREEYSNSNYVLLGRIIEIVSGQSYQDYMDKNIFKPLNMTNTSYDSPKRIINNRAYGYAKAGDLFENADYISMTQPFAAGAIVSTVDDLAKWQQGLFSYKVISKESLAKASEPFVLNNGETTGFGYSWGFNGYNIQGIPMITYNGAITGFIAATNYIPSEKVYVAILSNCRCHSPTKLIDNITALAIDKPYEWEEIKLDYDLLKSYQGIYTSEEFGDRHLLFENKGLLFYQPGGQKLKLYPFEKNKFFFKDPEYLVKTIEFINTNGKTQSIKMTSSGRDKNWTKTDEELKSYPAIKINVEDLNRYIGIYELGPNFYLNIFIDDKTLYSQATAQNITTLRAYEKDKFVSESSDIQHIFNYDENNDVKSMTILIGKNQYEANKVK